MADIFVSYARADKARVAPLVAALEARGWSLWWDPEITPGQEFDELITREIEAARAVIVVWTPSSVASRWVRGEARFAADRNVLVPVRFDQASLPLDVRAIHTTDLDDWGGDPQSVSFQSLYQSLVAMLGEPAAEGLPCVGRIKEIERIGELVERARRGDGALLVFSGEAGVGKTRMTLEAERIAKDNSFLVLRGHCSEMESAPPYQPVLEQIEQIARTLGPEAMRKSMGENAIELAKLMPELRQRYGDIPAYPTLPPEQERRYLLHGVAEFIARGAARQPLMLVFEDLHWADNSTCIFLRYIAERLKSEPVLLVGTYRDSELSSGAPFGRVLQELIRERLVEDMRLRRLSLGEIAELLHRLYGSEPPSTLTELIYSKTEGNPFFIEEVLRHLNEAGKLLTESGKFRERIEDGDAEVTRGVRLIIEDRIGRAGTHCREVLTIAAVAGRTFPFELLVKTDTKHNEDEILDAIEEAEGKNIIEDISKDRIARYRFVHEQIRQTLVSGLSMPRRQRLHLRIADALEAGHGAGADKYASEIGHHLYQAGAAADPARTAHHLGIAGGRAIDALAFEDALRQFEMAMSVLKDQGDAATLARLHAQRSEALRGAERIPESLEALSQAVALATTQEAKDELTLKRCRMLLDIWRGSEAVEDLEQLQARAHESGDAQRELGVQRAMGRVYYVMSLDRTGFADKSREAYERAIELARAQKDNKALAEILVATANLVDYWPDYAEQVKANLDEAVRVARAMGNEEVELDVATARLGFTMLGRSNIDDEQVLKRLVARRDPIRLNAFYFRMMWATFGSGRFERCIEICDAGIELAYRIGTLPVQYPTIKALALMELGRFGEARQSLEEEIADEAHRFGAALRDMGKLQYEILVGAYEAALERAPHVISEAHILVRAWMLRWISSLFAEAAPIFAKDEAVLARIDSLIASTKAPPRVEGQAALLFARGDLRGTRDALADETPTEFNIAFAAELARLQLLAAIEAQEAHLPVAIEKIKAAVDRARANKAKARLWYLLGEQAAIETALGKPDEASASRNEARAVLSEIGATIPDPKHRASLLGGRLASRLGLAS